MTYKEFRKFLAEIYRQTPELKVASMSTKERQEAYAATPKYTESGRKATDGRTQTT